MIKITLKGFRKFNRELQQVAKLTKRINRDYEITPMANGEISIKRKRYFHDLKAADKAILFIVSLGLVTLAIGIIGVIISHFV